MCGHRTGLNVLRTSLLGWFTLMQWMCTRRAWTTMILTGTHMIAWLSCLRRWLIILSMCALQETYGMQRGKQQGTPAKSAARILHRRNGRTIVGFQCRDVAARSDAKRSRRPCAAHALRPVTWNHSIYATQTRDASVGRIIWRQCTYLSQSTLIEFLSQFYVSY